MVMPLSLYEAGSAIPVAASNVASRNGLSGFGIGVFIKAGVAEPFTGSGDSGQAMSSSIPLMTT